MKKFLMGGTALSMLMTVSTGAFAEDGLDQAIDSILVVASAADVQDVPGSIDFLDADLLGEQSYGDINRVLRRTTGVYIQEEDGYGLRPNIGMRGSGLDRSAKITLMEDGVLVAPAPYASPAAYYFPNQGRMHSVEVSKGPAAVKYGPATVGGALNLISTPIPGDETIELKGDIGSDNQKRLYAMYGDQALHDSGATIGFMVEHFNDSTDGFKELDNGGDTGYQISDTLVKARVSGKLGGHQQSLEFAFGYVDQISDETYLGLTDADFAANPFRRYNGSQVDVMDLERTSYRLNHTIDLASNVQLSTVAYYSEFSRNWYKLDKVQGTSISSILADPMTHASAFADIVGAMGHVSADDALAVKNNNRDYEAKGIQSILSVDFDMHDMDHAVQVSVRYHEDEMDRFQWVDGYRMDNGTMIRTSVGVPGTDSNRIDSAEAWSFFVQDEITAGIFTVTPGVRYERIEFARDDYGKADPTRTGVALTKKRNDVDVIIPGLGVLAQVNDNVSLLAGVNRGFVPPSAGSSADPEKAWNYEAGARLFGEGGFMAEVIGFYSDYENLIGTCTASTGGGCVIGDQFDAGEVTVYGVEAKASGDLSSVIETDLRLPVWVSYTFTDTEFDTSFNSGFGPWGTVVEGDELPYVADHQFSLGAGAEGDGWQVHGVLSYVAETRAVAGQGAIPANERIEDHTVVDVSGTIALTKHIDLNGSITNLFDSEYAVARRPAGLRPGAPRLFRIGLSTNL